MTSGPPEGGWTGGEVTFEFEAEGSPAFTCDLDGVVETCTSPWRRSGLATGAHRFSVSAGGEPVVRQWNADRDAPSVAWHGSAPAFSLADSLTVRWDADDEGSGTAASDVRVRTGAWNSALGAWRHPEQWQGTTDSTVTTSLPPGTTACLSVRSRDRVGNASGWSPERCTSSPADDRVLTPSAGWSRGQGGGFYRATVSTAGSDDVRLTVSGIRARRLAIVATRCRTCGQVTVYVNGTRVATVNLRSGRTTPRALVELPAGRGVWRGTLVLVAGKGAQIDGLGVLPV